MLGLRAKKSVFVVIYRQNQIGINGSTCFQFVFIRVHSRLNLVAAKKLHPDLIAATVNIGQNLDSSPGKAARRAKLCHQLRLILLLPLSFPLLRPCSPAFVFLPLGEAQLLKLFI